MRNPRCPTGKKKMLDRLSADENARYLAKKLGEPFQSYICRECGFFHVGHTVPRPVRENTDRVRRFKPC